MILQILKRRLRGQTLASWAAMFDPVEAQASVDACVAEYSLEYGDTHNAASTDSSSGVRGNRTR